MGTLYAIAEAHSATVLKSKQLEESLKGIPIELIESNMKLKQIIKEIKHYCLFADALNLESGYERKVEETRNILGSIEPKVFFCEGESGIETNVSFIDRVGYKGKRIFLDDGNTIPDISEAYENMANRLIEDIQTRNIKKEDARNIIYSFKYHANKIHNKGMEEFWKVKIIQEFEEPSIIKCGRNHVISTSGDNTNLYNILKENDIDVKVVIDETQLFDSRAKKFNEYLLSLQ